MQTLNTVLGKPWYLSMIYILPLINLVFFFSNSTIQVCNEVSTANNYNLLLLFFLVALLLKMMWINAEEGKDVNQPQNKIKEKGS